MSNKYKYRKPKEKQPENQSYEKETLEIIIHQLEDGRVHLHHTPPDTFKGKHTPAQLLFLTMITEGMKKFQELTNAQATESWIGPPTDMDTMLKEQNFNESNRKDN